MNLYNNYIYRAIKGWFCNDVFFVGDSHFVNFELKGKIHLYKLLVVTIICNQTTKFLIHWGCIYLME